MPRHELVSPEEDLAAFYGGAPPAPPVPGATPPPLPASLPASGATPPPIPASLPASGAAPPPIPAAVGAAPPLSTSALRPTLSSVPPDLVDLLGPESESSPRPLAPVSRPAPNFTVPPELPAAPLPNVWVAALLSAVVPGVGQMYAGQTVKGLVFLLVAMFTCFGGGILNVVAALDALVIAQRKERGEVVTDWQFF